MRIARRHTKIHSHFVQVLDKMTIYILTWLRSNEIEIRSLCGQNDEELRFIKADCSRHPQAIW